MIGLLYSHNPAKYREDSAASYRAVAMLVSPTSYIIIETIVLSNTRY